MKMMKKATPGFYPILAAIVFAIGWSNSVVAQDTSSLEQVSAVPQPYIVPDEMRVQISDITTIKGHITNSIFGTGLVVGLSGTGGKSELTRRMAANLITNSTGVVDAANNSKNIAVVAVTAEIPPFARVGEKITVQVSVVDDATSLKGGQLLLTPLEGVDSQIYATANGAVLGNGFAVSGNAGGVQKNHPTSGTSSATVVKEICMDNIQDRGILELLLINKDSLTSTRIANAINHLFPGNAESVDQGMVRIRIPESLQKSRNDFISMIGSLTVVPNMPATVIVNQRTGTIVVGKRVRLSHVMFANDNLIVTTSETPTVSQPNAFSNGETAIVPRTQITAVEEGGRYNILREGIELGELAEALNAMGVSPQDLITIFQSLESSGALHAKIIYE